MRQRIKQTLSREKKGKFFLRRKLNTKLLHSGKGIYFYKLLNYSGVTPLTLASLALLFILGLMIMPFGVSGESAYAETITYPAVEGKNDIATISFTLNGNDIDGSEVSTEVIPDDISYISNNLKISTNNIGKFAIVIQSASDSGNLVNSENGAIIAPITTATTPDGFSNNTWGYALSDNTATVDSQLTYSPLPAFQEEPTAQYTKDNPDDGDYDLKLVFAAKIGSNKPAGHYRTTALVSVVAEAKEIITPTTPVTNWDDLQYMQQMSPEACNSATTPATSATDVPAKQLIDIRDGKTYWVSKLADGNCWMTQNLDFDLWDEENNIAITLSPDSSNVSADWPSTTGPSTTSGYNNGNYYLAQYYDPGYAYYTNNTSTTTIKNDIDDTTEEQWAKDTTGNENTHYMQGNLYSWTAATAGSGDSSVTSDNAPDSICPKGWQLPTSNNTDAAQKSFGGLTTAYGIANSSTGSTAMRSAPRYFIYGGNVFFGNFSSAGSYGYYWSSTADSSYAYSLYLYSSYANPSSNGFRYYGYSVRCVAR